MRKNGPPVRVLAIDPTSRGFGFIILEGPGVVIDWGVKSGRKVSIEREQQLLARFSDLVQLYQPQTLILENTSAPDSRRCGRVRLLVGTMKNIATWQNIPVRNINPFQLKGVFLTFGARTKYEIARVIAMQLPEIASWLPRPRKPWMAEDYRMAVFDAAALALTFFYAGKGSPGR